MCVCACVYVYQSGTARTDGKRDVAAEQSRAQQITQRLRLQTHAQRNERV